MIRIKKGLTLPIAGSPEMTVDDGRPARSAALLGYDYPGLKPTMEVKEGDRVIKGQLVFTDKKIPGIRFTAPATGTVTAINRGARRAFLSLVVEIDEGGESEETTFESYQPADLAGLEREKVVAQLIDSGEWTAIRKRPFAKVPAPDEVPAHVFINAMDTRPLAAPPERFIAEHTDAFLAGIAVMLRLTEGNVFVCSAAHGGNEGAIPRAEDARVRYEQFDGPHPAGLVGTHIHFLAPVSTKRSVWYLDYQNLIAIGYLFTTGKIFSDRLVALAGPGVERPRLVRTRVGASTIEMTAGELREGTHRVISGSVLDGRTAAGATAYLGRHHNQVSVLREGTDREFFGFVMPGREKYSVTRLFISRMIGAKNLPLTTSTGGSERAMVPIGTYEEVMPLDILPTQLLRALLVSDIDSAIALGCLELDEEDLALCTYTCPGKYEYGPYLREMLDRVEAEG